MTAPRLRALKGVRRIVAITAWDYPTARLVDESPLDLLLVGDSLGPNVLGHPSTLQVTLDEMVAAARAVTRATSRILVVGDLPFGTYQVSVEDAVRSALRFVQEGGVAAVKLEGGAERAPAVRAIVEAGIPVMGHVGLLPQSMHNMGGYKVQGRGDAEAARLLHDAEAIASAGAFSLVLEGVPAALGAEITKRTPIPTIGIGAGAGCDGQILVLADLIGLSFCRTPKFVRRYADVGASIREALRAFHGDVVEGRFPADGETYS